VPRVAGSNPVIHPDYKSFGEIRSFFVFVLNPVFLLDYGKFSSLKKACRFRQTFLNLNKIETLMTVSKIILGFGSSINLWLSYGQLISGLILPPEGTIAVGL